MSRAFQNIIKSFSIKYFSIYKITIEVTVSAALALPKISDRWQNLLNIVHDRNLDICQNQGHWKLYLLFLFLYKNEFLVKMKIRETFFRT